MVWTVITDILLVIFVLDCAFMGLVIMMQRSKQEGLGAAFGGGFTESIWGAQTSNVLVKATCWAAGIFFALALILARLYAHSAVPVVNQSSSIQQQLLAPAPITTNAISTPVVPPPAAHAAAPTAAGPTSTPVPPTATAPSTSTPVKVTTPAAPAKPSGK